MTHAATLPTLDVRCGDSLKLLRAMPEKSVHMAVCSPPYFSLRNYQCAGQIGLESTPAEYVAKLVELFGELRRVLRDDGTFWLNIGDTYANDAKTKKGTPGSLLDGRANLDGVPKSWRDGNAKKKDRLGIPHRVAFALQDDGWYFRDEIVWAKRNGMPSSVKDRTTGSHEFVFMFSKKKHYFYDATAIREPAAVGSRGSKFHEGKTATHQSGRSSKKPRESEPEFRNKRSVWSLSSEPFRGGHYAAYPTKLVTPCILAGTSAHGVCAACGVPWVRITNKSKWRRERPNSLTKRTGESGTGNVCPNDVAGVTVETTGWRPTCECGATDDIRPGDFEIIDTPTGSRVGDDPTMETGRAGMNRPRGPDEGARPITRYEQRKYAEQLKASSHRGEMEAEAGSAFAHYIRTDRSGARPIPPDLLVSWSSRGWLAPVSPPSLVSPHVVPATVLDPFSGAATTGVVCIRTGRSYIGLELNPEYVALSEERLRAESHKFNQDGPDSLFSTLNATATDTAVQSASEVVYANH